MRFKLLDIVIIICIFFTLSSVKTGVVDLYYYYIVILVVLPLLVIKRKTLSIGLFTISIFVFLAGLLNILLKNDTFANLLKQWIGVFIAYFFYDYLIKNARFDLIRIFRTYLKFSVIVAWIGIFQFISYLIGFKYGYDFSWLGLRTIIEPHGWGYLVHSILPEPSHLGLVLSAAIFVSVYNLLFQRSFLISKRSSIIILITTILSGSSTAYAAIAFSMLLLFINRLNFKYFIILPLFAVLAFYSLYGFVPKFAARINSMTYSFSNNIFASKEALKELDGSTLILLNSFYVATKNFRNDPLLGGGLGSHPIAYDKYSLLKGFWESGLNKDDASSLFNRLLSETGLIGLIFSLYFLIKFYVSYKQDKSNDRINWLISNAILVMIFTYLLRQGHYFLNGFPLFVLMYYYNGIDNKRLKFQEGLKTGCLDVAN